VRSGKTDGVRDVPDVVRAKAEVVGASSWLRDLAELIDAVAEEWGLDVGEAFPDATEAFVAPASTRDGTPAVLKLIVPRDGDAARNEIIALRLADGDGCARLLRDDVARRALLVECLGPSLHDLGLPIGERHEILCATARRVWRPAPGSGLPNGADKGRWLIDSITRLWDELERPCSERAIDDAVRCAGQRVAAHDDERAVLVHGDVHEWNTLQAGDTYRLVDPDGLLAEAEYDLGIIMREDPGDISLTDPGDRARWLAARTGCDPVAIWEWGVVERVSTGLIGTQIGLQPVAAEMLAVADRVSTYRFG